MNSAVDFGKTRKMNKKLKVQYNRIIKAESKFQTAMNTLESYLKPYIKIEFAITMSDPDGIVMAVYNDDTDLDELFPIPEVFRVLELHK